MSVISAPELDVLYTKKRKRDDEVPLILRPPQSRPPTVFATVPTPRVIDPPTPFSLRRRAAKPSPTVDDQAVQSPRSESPGSASAERPEPPLDADGDDAREPFAPPNEDEDDDAPQPFAPPPDAAQERFASPPDDAEEEYDDEEEDEENYEDEEQYAADEFERVAREELDDPSF